jgi:hypothetical protein
MTSSSDYPEKDRLVEAWCDPHHLHVVLADGRQVLAPLWWYPFLESTSPDDRANIELMFEGAWWPAMDEGVSVKSMLLGWKAPGARQPQQAA